MKVFNCIMFLVKMCCRGREWKWKRKSNWNMIEGQALSHCMCRISRVGIRLMTDSFRSQLRSSDSPWQAETNCRPMTLPIYPAVAPQPVLWLLLLASSSDSAPGACYVLSPYFLLCRVDIHRRDNIAPETVSFCWPFFFLFNSLKT